MIVRLIILCICMPLYSQEVTIHRIRNTEIVAQIKGFSDGLLRSWGESAGIAERYIKSNSHCQFKREFYVLQVLSIFQQLQHQGIAVIVEEKDREFTVTCIHPKEAEQEVLRLLHQSPFIFELDIPDARPEDPIERAEYDIEDAGGDSWFKIEGNVVLAKDSQPDQELTELWLGNTQTQELDPIEDLHN